MIWWILIVLGVLAFAWLIWSVQNDKQDLNFWTSFTSVCPVCHTSRRWSLEKLASRAATMSLEEIAALEMKCLQCEADLTGLYLLHPHTKAALIGAAEARRRKEIATEYVKQLQVDDAAEPLAQERKRVR